MNRRSIIEKSLDFLQFLSGCFRVGGVFLRLSPDQNHREFFLDNHLSLFQRLLI